MPAHMKKLIILLCLLTAACACALAEEVAEEPGTFTSGYYTYFLLEDGTAQIVTWTGRAEMLRIPETLDGYDVTALGADCIMPANTLVSVTLPACVTTIEGNPFSQAPYLERVRVAEGHEAFISVDGVLFSADGATLLCYPRGKAGDSYVVPDGTVSLGERAFFGANALKDVRLPDGLARIGSGAFWLCTGITDLDLPESVVAIGDFAFYRTGITHFTFPQNVETFGANPFAGCASLEGFTLPEGDDTLFMLDGALYHRGERKLVCCLPTREGDTFSIPDGCRCIGGGAFLQCTKLRDIPIPDSVTSIGEKAFQGCVSLEAIALPPGLEDLGEGAFTECELLEEVVLPEGLAGVADKLFMNCASLTRVVLPEGCTSIGNSAFYGCERMARFELPQGLKSIGRSAFTACDSLVEIDIPDGVTSIGPAAFADCERLEHIALPDGLNAVTNHMFDRCSALTALTIPEGVTAIDDLAFRQSGLTRIDIPDSVTEVAPAAFAQSALEGITVSDAHAVLSYEGGALIDCVNGRLLFYRDRETGASYEIPEGIVSISPNAFSGSAALRSVTLPDTVREIGSYAFLYCAALESCAIPEGVAELGAETFYGCASLERLVIPESVEKIASSALGACPMLTVVTPQGSYAESFCLEKDIPVTYAP